MEGPNNSYIRPRHNDQYLPEWFVKSSVYNITTRIIQGALRALNLLATGLCRIGSMICNFGAKKHHTIIEMKKDMATCLESSSDLDYNKMQSAKLFFVVTQKESIYWDSIIYTEIEEGFPGQVENFFEKMKNNCKINERETFLVNIIVLIKNIDGSYNEAQILKYNTVTDNPSHSGTSRIRPESFQKHLGIMLKRNDMPTQIDEDGNFI